MGGQFFDALAVVEQFAGAHAERAGDGVEGGGFAGAVGTDQRHEFALGKLEADAFDGLDGAVGDLHVAQLEDGRVAHGVAPALGLAWPPR